MNSKLGWWLIGLICGVALASGVAAAQRSYGTPTSVLHVVSVQWKPESTEAERQRALEGVKGMAAKIEGIKNVWIKATRVQPREFNAAFAIEFENRAAADAYVEHPAHKEWEGIYLPIREQSRSLQITN